MGHALGSSSQEREKEKKKEKEREMDGSSQSSLLTSWLVLPPHMLCHCHSLVFEED